METVVGSNQGESSNEWKGHKTPFQMADTQNREGAETGVSPESEWQAAAGESAPFAPPANEINITASTENRSAKWKNGEGIGRKSDGETQYQ